MRLIVALTIALSQLAWLTEAVPMPLASTLVKRAQFIASASNVPTDVTYDYIIVGGGTTGLTAASRLSSANSNARILIVEAGGDTREDEKIKSHARYGAAFGDERYDFGYRTTTQDVSQKSYAMIQGRGLGGSSTINGGAYTLPPLSELEAFLELGNATYSAPDLFDYIKRTQGYVPPSDAVRALGANANMGAHSTDGPITVGFSDRMFTGPQERAFLKAQQEALNAPTLIDLGDASEQAGAAFIPQTTIPNSGDDRLRVSAATAFLSAEGRMGINVDIVLNTRASKLVYGIGLGLDQVLASGVEIQSSRDGPTVQVKGKKVIVAAGALSTPPFLEHSGIGDRSILAALGVDVKVDLPGVGRNLIEQQKIDVVATKPAQAIGGTVSPSAAISMNSIGQLMNNASDVRGYVEQNMQRWALDAVNAGASASLDGLVAQYKAMVTGIFEKGWPISETFFVSADDFFLQSIWALMSFSRGYVHATSTSPWDAPKLNPRHWTSPIDMDFQIAGTRGARKVFQTEAMRNVINGGESSPGFETVRQAADDPNAGPYASWRQWILDGYEPNNHPLGTCAMAPRSLGGVVDDGFKVYGTSNVFVIDASVLTIQQSTHLTSILYGIATKAATLIV